MTREVMLLRGVNVGGSRKLPMATLRSGLEAAGFADVVTYIQSGNAVITPPKSATEDLQAWAERAVAAIAGFDVPIVLRSPQELEQTMHRNPYPDAGGTQLHVLFFSKAPNSEVLEGVDLENFKPEACTLVNRDLYLHLPNGIGRAKLPAALDKATRAASPPVVGTARNWNTVVKLVELAGRSTPVR